MLKYLKTKNLNLVLKLKLRGIDFPCNNILMLNAFSKAKNHISEFEI